MTETVHDVIPRLRKPRMRFDRVRKRWVCAGSFGGIAGSGKDMPAAYAAYERAYKQWRKRVGYR